MDLVNDFLNQIMKNTTIDLRINIPIHPNPSNHPTGRSFSSSPSNHTVITQPNANSLDSEIAALQAKPNHETNEIPTGVLPSQVPPERQFEQVLKSEDFLKQLFENMTQRSQEAPANDDICTLISQLELVISTLRKILAGVKTQQTNAHYLVMIDNYIEMLENFDKILKSFKFIRSSFNF